MQVPSNMLLTRVRPSIYLAACMIIWSAISGPFSAFDHPVYLVIHPLTIFDLVACTGLASSYGSLVACRFLLGFFEAPVSSVGPLRQKETHWSRLQFYPGALYLLAIFYTRKGQISWTLLP